MLEKSSLTITLLYRVLNLVDALAKEIRHMAVDLTKLQSDVTAQSTIVTSVQTLLASLAQQISDLKNAGTSDAATQAAIDQLSAAVEANSTVLANAVTANTPAAPAAPAAPVAPAAPTS